MQIAEEYAEIIMRDERAKIVKETPTVYTEEKIVRIYEFPDGAEVKYEWQFTPDGRTAPDERFNHKFTLVKPPNPNPHNLKEGIIKQINYKRQDQER